jgi:hypothetical protein
MRIAMIGVLLIVSLVIAVLVVPNVGLAQRTAPSFTPGSGTLVALAAPAGEHSQQVTIIDPEKHVLGVYHIDLTSGEIVLKSVRNIHWDLQMGEFNGTKPLPVEVRSMLEQR